MCKFSIMVPLYNKLPQLKLYFERIINQSFTDYEIVVVDDCSFDGSYEYIKSLNNDKIKLYRNNINLGLGLTRNELLKHANGKYLLFVDPDDYIEYDLLKVLDEHLNNGIDVLRFQNESVPTTEEQRKIEEEKGIYRFCCRPTGIISGEDALLEWFTGENNINTLPWTYCIKSTLYDGIKYPDLSVLEDFSVTPYIVAKAKKVKAIDYRGYYYLQYNESLTKVNLPKDENIKYAYYKLGILKNVIELLKDNINKTNVSFEKKSLFFKDLDYRYAIRKKRCERIRGEK